MSEATFGRYRLISLLGEGGMGKVFRAHDTVMDRDVAIKLLTPELSVRPNYEDRFEREARAAGKLVEPHVIPVYEAGEIGGQLFLVMPVIDGEDVHALLKREGPMDPTRAVRVIEQLAAALGAAHKAGLVHRDVKPSNALIADHDFVYLIDFGIVHDTKGVKITQTGMIMGTPPYMAPERFTAGITDARSDIYALACVLYECLTANHPYPGDSLEQQLHAHINLEPPKPSTLRPDLPGGFDEVIAIGMAKNPEARYQTARSLAEAAREALSTVPLPTKRDPTDETQLKTEIRPLVDLPPRRRNRRTFATVATIVALVAGGILGYQQLKPHPRPSPSPISRPTTSIHSTAPDLVAPSTSATATPFTFAVTGFKASGDTVTITYTDAGGVRHTARPATLPWRTTVMMSWLPFGVLAATSLTKNSKLNCTITSSTGQMVRSSTSNSASTSC